MCQNFIDQTYPLKIQQNEIKKRKKNDYFSLSVNIKSTGNNTNPLEIVCICCCS